MTEQTSDISGPPNWLAAAKHVVLALTFLLTLTIACLTLTPVNTSAASQVSDKLLHAIAFIGLILPCAVLTPRALVYVVPFAIIFGALIEIIQPNVGREAEFMDFVANTIGVWLGVVTDLFIRYVTGLNAHDALHRSAN